jgi:hypothetical protein
MEIASAECVLSLPRRHGRARPGHPRTTPKRHKGVDARIEAGHDDERSPEAMSRQAAGKRRKPPRKREFQLIALAPSLPPVQKSTTGRG